MCKVVYIAKVRNSKQKKNNIYFLTVQKVIYFLLHLQIYPNYILFIRTKGSTIAVVVYMNSKHCCFFTQIRGDKYENLTCSQQILIKWWLSHLQGVNTYSIFKKKFIFIILNKLCIIYSVLFNNSTRPKKKICVFSVTRPTLIFASDPMNFYTEFG